MGWGGKGTSREKRKVGDEREEGRKEGKEGECNVAQ